MDLQSIQTTAEDIAKSAADVLMRYYHSGVSMHTKSSKVDIVTEADQLSEAVIVEALTTIYPDHHIVGEEGGGMGAPIEEATYHWYVDPLDGTTNFANHIPMFCVSMAMTDAEMNPLVGVVYNPVSGELFSAVKGGGATLNGQPIHVSEKDELTACVLASGFPYDKYTDPDNNLDLWGKFLVRTRGLRRMGSAALDCCYVAAGRFDAYWEAKVYPWDVLAGMLCVTEAGGTVSDYRGDNPPCMVMGRRVVVSNGKIHDAMLQVINGKGE
ncbi:MAG: inositol monophosphatase [Phototrophicales bacterium]|nr:MAG: inositol monophosphatase [Phototrophicales bacterium]RMG71951.1 MAG: inositol monophosphatase [Chloroflexota bacterium]